MALHPNFTRAVKILHPQARFGVDLLVRDDSDGKGRYLAEWNLPGNPPTDAEIEAVMARSAKVKNRGEKLAALLEREGLTLADLKAELAK